MPLHHLTEQNQVQFYCRGCEEKIVDEKSNLVENTFYRILKCKCGNESWTRDNFHKRSYADGDGFIGVESLL